MKRILKYEIKTTSEEVTTIALNQDSQILKIDIQHDKVQMWVIIDDNKPLIKTDFVIKMTGQYIGDNLLPVGTVLLHNGFYILHIFKIMAG